MLDKEDMKLLEEDVKKFDETNGMVTVEFSVKKDKLDETFEILRNFRSNIGKWIAMDCKTCVEYHGANSVHVSLEKLNKLNI